MNLLNLKVLEHQQIAKGTYRLVLQKPQSITIEPGQFAMVKVEGKFLKRPLSISDYDKTSVTFIYKVLGFGTEMLAQSAPTHIECLLPLGIGFKVKKQKAVLIAGGVGIAPMHALAKELANNACDLQIHLGYKTADEIFLANELAKYGQVNIYTEDGSSGISGNCLPTSIDSEAVIYSCGPHPMLNAVANKYENEGQLSTEEYMACGFGICAGCAIKLKSGIKKVCQDGPVFAKEEFEC